LLEFDGGNHTGFWKLWEENVPAEIRNKDQTCQRLEFYIQIHFAVYPIRVRTTQTVSCRKTNVGGLVFQFLFEFMCSY